MLCSDPCCDVCCVCCVPRLAPLLLLLLPRQSYAFLEMRSVEEASNAMAFDGVVFKDTNLKVGLLLLLLLSAVVLLLLPPAALVLVAYTQTLAAEMHGAAAAATGACATVIDAYKPRSRDAYASLS